MKFTSFCFIVLFMLIIISCSPQRKTSQNASGRATTDSVEYYDAEVEIRQKNYLDQLLGSWTVNTMKRQARIDAENLTNVFLTFNRDFSFTGNAGCNNISGKYSLKGTSIKFNDIISTKMACDRIEQENELLRLLQQTVSAYTINRNTLWLRDNSSNIIFDATRRGNQ
ncbi:MAG: META domain-containing protein [Chitinophagaceae bacterium]